MADTIPDYGQMEYDVAVIGASVAGCVTAVLFARRGLKVIMLERRSDIQAYKKMCTHYVQACALPTLRRLGIIEQLESCGGIRNSIHVWSPYGWIRPYASTPRERASHGYNIRREKLDPLLRELAIRTQGVTYIGGKSPKRLLIRAGRVCGVSIETAAGDPVDLRAKLVVGADGRNSITARLSGATEKSEPNGRVFFLSYFKNLPLKTGRTSQMWFLDPEIAYAFPCDDDLTLLCAGIDEARLEGFRKDVAGHFIRHFRALPDGPDMALGQQATEIIMGKRMDTVWRRSTMAGMTLVGDALLAADPYPGVGIGWAMQAAERLVDSTTDALIAGGNLEHCVKRYEKSHHRAVGGHVKLIASYSACRKLRLLYPPEKLFFSAGAKDEIVANHIDAYLNRIITAKQTVMSKVTLRALWVNLKNFCMRHLFWGFRKEPGPQQPSPQQPSPQ